MSTVTRLWPDQPKFDTWQGQKCLSATTSRLTLGSIPFSVTVGTGVSYPGHEADNVPLPSIGFKKAWSFISTPYFSCHRV